MTIDESLLGSAIARVRKMRGITQAKLNEMVGIKTIAHIEQGRYTVSFPTLNAIAEALEIPPACLVVLGTKESPNDQLLSNLASLIDASIDLGLSEESKTETKTVKQESKKKKKVPKKRNRKRKPVLT